MDEKISLFSEDQIKSVRKNFSHSSFLMKVSTKNFSNDDCENCLYRGSTPYKSYGWKKFTLFRRPNKKC